MRLASNVGTAGPIGISNLGRHISGGFRQGKHFIRKIDKVLFNGRLSGQSDPTQLRSIRPPYLTKEFRGFLDPDRMYSKEIYNLDQLKLIVGGSDEELYSRETLILRIATIEQLCRELGFRPESDFFSKLI